eukprot:522887_1
MQTSTIVNRLEFIGIAQNNHVGIHTSIAGEEGHYGAMFVITFCVFLFFCMTIIAYHWTFRKTSLSANHPIDSFHSILVTDRTSMKQTGENKYNPAVYPYNTEEFVDIDLASEHTDTEHEPVAL